MNKKKNQHIGYGEHSLTKLNKFYNKLSLSYCCLTMLGLTMYIKSLDTQSQTVNYY